MWRPARDARDGGPRIPRWLTWGLYRRGWRSKAEITPLAWVQLWYVAAVGALGGYDTGEFFLFSRRQSRRRRRGESPHPQNTTPPKQAAT